MPSSLVMAVRLLSAFHGRRPMTVVGTGVPQGRGVVDGNKSSFEDTIRKVVFDPKYFPTFLGGICLVSGVAGFQFMEHVKRQVPAVNRALYGNA